jgi:ABC transporter substrate binding protein
VCGLQIGVQNGQSSPSANVTPGYALDGYAGPDSWSAPIPCSAQLEAAQRGPRFTISLKRRRGLQTRNSGVLGLGIIGEPYRLSRTARRQIAAFALASRLPTIYARRDFAEDGGLISYGISQRETYHRAAYYVDRILKGQKPADLPIEFATRLELVINAADAKAIGLVVPPTMLARADEVIE